jgi:hypothetical protein
LLFTMQAVLGSNVALMQTLYLAGRLFLEVLKAREPSEGGVVGTLVDLLSVERRNGNVPVSVR